MFIDLSCHSVTSYIGIIVLDDNGVLISNQSGGLLCTHPRVKGFYIPLPANWMPDTDPFSDEWMTDYDEKRVDAFLDDMKEKTKGDFILTNGFPFKPLHDLSIVREIMEDPLAYGESWIPVEIIADTEIFKGMIGKIAIIVHDNSD